MNRKQIVLNFTEWDEETFRLLQETYPHKKDADILRELMFQWRLKHDNNDTKDGKLSALIEKVDGLSHAIEELREEIVEIKLSMHVHAM